MTTPLAAAGLLFGTNDTQLQNILGENASLTSSIQALTNMNEAMAYASTVCETNCTQLTQNISVFVSPGAVVGPVQFTQSCQISDVQCAIDAFVTTGIQNSLQQIKDNGYNVQLTNSSLYAITPNTINSTQSLDESMRNNLYQMVSSSCLFQSNQVLSNNYVYIGTGATTGAISFAQSSQITSTDCTIDVIAKANTYQVDQPNQSNTMITLLLIIIGIVLVIMIIFVIIFFLAGGDKRLAHFFNRNRPRTLSSAAYYNTAIQAPAPYPTQDLPFIPLTS